MKLSQAVLFLLTFFTTAHALTLPALLTSESNSATNLFKRKGGGGGGGRGGSSSSSGSSSSGGRTSGSSSGSSSSSSSSRGGSTSAGTGSTRGFGSSGGYYGGGAATPYRTGSRSPSRSVAPFLVGGAALAFFPALALYGAYAYNFGGPYHYYNRTSGTNESLPMSCYCGRFSTSCGCEGNNNTDYLNSIASNSSIAQKAVVNGTETLVVDGTLQNGTTAPGESTTGGAGSLRQQLVEGSGLWVVVAGVAYTVWAM